MRFYLLTDDEDIAVGMRLAGIEGSVFSVEETIDDKLNELFASDDIGMILINTSLVEANKAVVSQFRKTHTVPLIVEIPDKNATVQSNAISDYVREAIGIKI